MFINESEILQPQDWSFPIPIAYGPGRIAEIANLCLQHGIRKPLIVTDKGSENLPFSIKLQELLNDGKITFDVFADISPNPCLLYTSPSPRDQRGSRMPSSA